MNFEKSTVEKSKEEIPSIDNEKTIDENELDQVTGGSYGCGPTYWQCTFDRDHRWLINIYTENLPEGRPCRKPGCHGVLMRK